MRLLEHPRWPQLRAALILFHALSIVVLSLPSASAFNAGRWQTDNARDDLRRMATRLTDWGWPHDEHSLERRLRSMQGGYLRVQTQLVRPFALYAGLTGSRQDWSMFASPQRHPAELHVDIEEAGQWRALYRPHRDDSAWKRAVFEHNRMRKFLGRFARDLRRDDYEHSVQWVAAQALRDHADAARVRVRLYRYASLAPEQVIAGAHPIGRYEHERVVHRTASAENER